MTVMTSAQRLLKALQLNIIQIEEEIVTILSELTTHISELKNTTKEKLENADPLTLGEVASLRTELKDLEALLGSSTESVKNLRNQVDISLIKKMEEEGTLTVKTSGAKKSLVLKEEKVYNISDPEALSRFVVESGYTQVYQKRLTQQSVRDLIDSGFEVPGVSVYSKKSIV